MSTITTPAVAPNDLIESSWGNAVRADLTSLNADKAELSGATFTGDVSGIAPTSPAHFTRKDYVDGVVAGLLSSAGGTVTGGSITIATSGEGVNLPSGEPSGPARAARKDYVDTQVGTRLATTGGTVTGSITITTSGQGINLPTGEPSSAARAARKDYVDGQVASRVPLTGGTMSGALTANGGVLVPNPSNVAHATRKSYVDNLIAGRLPLSGGTMTGPIYVRNSNPAGVADGGSIVLETQGRILGALNDITRSNLWLRRYGGAAGIGSDFALFVREGTGVGAIRIASASSVQFLTSSDPRLKDRDGAVLDALDRARRLGRAAFRGRWKDDADSGVWDFLSSNDVEDIAPYAVSGARDAVNQDGSVDPQKVDFGHLVPLLFAAVAELADRIEGGQS